MSGSAGPRRVSSREWPLDLDHCWEDRESVEVSTAYGRGTSLEVLGQHHQRLKGYVHVHGNPTSGYEGAMAWAGAVVLVVTVSACAATPHQEGEMLGGTHVMPN